MAITFAKQKQKEKTLIIVLVVVIVAIIIIWGRNFFTQNLAILPPTSMLLLPKIEINFDVLKHPLLETLQPLEEIPSFQEKVGRENPFSPYTLSKEVKSEIQISTSSFTSTSTSTQPQ